MLSYSWLLCKRVAVLLPGLAIAFLATRTVLPYFGRHLPIALAIACTYLVAAYILIPAMMRLHRIFIPEKHLPLYCTTPDGFASDPLNIGIIGTEAQLITAMELAGWTVAQPINPRSVLTAIVSVLLKKPYPGAPMSSLYLFGRKHDIGFERQLIEAGRGHRHHVRFWATTLGDMGHGRIAPIGGAHVNDKKLADHLLWAGAASRDVGITFAAGRLQFTHAVSPHTDQERAMLQEELASLGLADTVTTLRLHPPYNLPNFAWARALRTDGKMAVLRLKK